MPRDADEPLNDEGASGGAAGFFGDPAMDRFAAAFLRLLSEHWVQAEKLTDLVRLLETNGLIAPGDLERIGQKSDNDAERDRAAAEFTRRILAPLRESART